MLSGNTEIIVTKLIFWFRWLFLTLERYIQKKKMAKTLVVNYPYNWDREALLTYKNV